MNSKEHMKIALVHMDIKHGKIKENTRHLIELNKEAASRGANLIINPELCLSGYSFNNRADIVGNIESVDGPALKSLSRIAKQHSAYICVGIAELDKFTDIFYNSAMVLSPDDSIVCRYRKINAEMRWACPGSPGQENIFDTPWGRIGVLICSDTYYGLIPRSTALRGADMIIVPANWPPAGLDPVELWQARAMENKVYFAVCNRAGDDVTMNFDEAVSCVIDPDGQALTTGKSKESKIFYCDIELKNGTLKNHGSKRLRSKRNPSAYGNIYLDFRLIDDLTGHYDLPGPGEMHFHCISISKNTAFSIESISNTINNNKRNGYNLFILPDGLIDKDTTIYLAETHNTGITCACSLHEKKSVNIFAVTNKEGGIEVKIGAGIKSDSEHSMIADYGTARIGFLKKNDVYNPEAFVNLSKLGCDIAVLSGTKIDETKRLLLGIKTVERIAIAGSFQNGAIICTPPEGHNRWHEALVNENECCSYTLDTNYTREKRFQERIDYDLLLRKEVLN